MTSIARETDGGFTVTAGEIRWQRFLLFATGVEDVLPEIAGALERVREGVLRCCPICDAFEVIGLDLAVVGPGACAAGVWNPRFRAAMMALGSAFQMNGFGLSALYSRTKRLMAAWRSTTNERRRA